MRVRPGILAIAVFVAAPVHAQQVELMHFEGTPQSIVLNVGQLPEKLSMEAQARPLNDVLVADFRQLGSQNNDFIQDTLVLASPIDVPAWMRTGIAGGGSIGSFLINATGESCAASRYRPRQDISFSAEQRRAQLYPLISAVACEHGLPIGLFDSLIAQESRYQVNALSGAGAIGLAQLMPGTARYLGVSNPWDPVQNLRGGARYLREQLNEFGRVDLALAAYNAGPGRVRSTRKIPMIRETVNYVAAVTTAWSANSKVEAAKVMPRTNGTVRNPFRQASVVTYTSSSTSNPM